MLFSSTICYHLLIQFLHSKGTSLFAQFEYLLALLTLLSTLAMLLRVARGLSAFPNRLFYYIEGYSMGLLVKAC